MNGGKAIFDISKRTFIAAAAVLAFFLLVSAALTYVIPKGKFASVTSADGVVTVDYGEYIPLADAGGIPVWKALLSPLLLFFADGAVQPLMLMLFLLIIAGVFQIMKDCGAMTAIVGRIARKYRDRKRLFIALIVLLFMLLGSLFGLFEETLIVLPMVISICVGLGFDPATGFIICTVATGFGFSAAISNPFTVVYASELIGASVTSSLWFRLLIFAVYYLIVLASAFSHIKRLPASDVPVTDAVSVGDAVTGGDAVNGGGNRQLAVYTVFLTFVFIATIVISSVGSLRGLSTPLLAAVFLFGGGAAGIIACGFGNAARSFGKGAVSTLPALLLICLAFSVKYVLTEGMVLDTITDSLARLVESKPPCATVFILFGIILFLEFFISSSTAKAAFVMGVLSGVVSSGSMHISRELLVLIYIFSDGFTNVIFPTSPVLLIGLSMTDQDYFGWLKRGKFLFAAAFLTAAAFLLAGLAINY